MATTKETLTRWVKMLRSGDYKQTTQQIGVVNKATGEQRYCCLGVLCLAADGTLTQTASRPEVLPPQEWASLELEDSDELNWSGEDSDFLQKFLSRGEISTCMHMNDKYGKSFDEIADFIETDVLKENVSVG